MKGLRTGFRRVMSMIALGGALVALSACAAHKDLKAPCSASWSLLGGSAIAAGDCGPMQLINE